jgi:hypothetical protein
MRADEYKIAIELHKEGASSERAQTVELAKEASRDTKNAQMVIQLVMKWFGLDFINATMLVSIFIIGAFEILGTYAGGQYIKYRNMLPEYGIDLHKDHEIKYLKQDLKRQKKKNIEISKYNIFKSKQDLELMKNNQANQGKIRKLQDEIQKLSGGQSPAMAYSNNLAPGLNEPITATKQPIGFVNTDAPVIKHDIPASLPPLTINNLDVSGLDMEGLTLEQLQARRAEYWQAYRSSDNPVCPACNQSFIRRNWQEVFCTADHRNEFNNQIKRLKKRG